MIAPQLARAWSPIGVHEWSNGTVKTQSRIILSLCIRRYQFVLVDTPENGVSNMPKLAPMKLRNGNKPDNVLQT